MIIKRRKNQLLVEDGGMYHQYKCPWVFPEAEKAKQAKKEIDAIPVLTPNEFDIACAIMKKHEGKEKLF